MQDVVGHAVPFDPQQAMQMYVFVHVYTAFIKYVMCAAVQSCSGLAVLVSNDRRNPCPTARHLSAMYCRDFIRATIQDAQAATNCSLAVHPRRPLRHIWRLDRTFAVAATAVVAAVE